MDVPTSGDDQPVENDAELNMQRTNYCDLDDTLDLTADNFKATRFDPLNLRRAVDSYREVIARRGTARTYQERMEFQVIAQSMRTAWKIWNGRDELHELAFGGVSDNRNESDTLPG